MRSVPIAAILAAALMSATPMAQLPAPDRTRPPQPGPAPRLTLPPIQKHALGNRLPVWVVEMHEVPLVQVALIVRAGAAADPADLPGVASLTADMLDEGAGELGALELADAIDVLGASLSTSSDYDASLVRLSVPVARLEPALALMADVVQRPTFADEELDRLRALRLTAMLQARDDPAAIASLAYPRLLYGTDYRYGLPDSGTPATMTSVTSDDLRAFHAARYRPDNALLLVAGDVTPAAVQPLLERAFGKWRGEGPAPSPATLPDAVQPAARRVYLVDKPQAAQSQVRIGWIGVPRTTPDYFPLTVMNTILGGSFTSRLNMNLREEHGYAYGAFSDFAMRRGAGPFTAAAGVQTDKTAEAVAEFLSELTGIRAPVPAAELHRAKQYLALGFPNAFETTGDMIGMLQELWIYQLPEDTYERYVPEVSGVTAAAVERVASQHIQADRCLIVIVGDRARVEAPLVRLGLGSLTVLSIDEAIGPAPKPSN